MSKQMLKERLEESYQLWDNQLCSGGSDPFYADGVNLNLLRGHIIRYKQQIAEDGVLPEIYHRKTPEELPDNFMVQAENIYWNAVERFRQCKEDVDYQYLSNLELNPKMKKGLEIINALKNVRELEIAIKGQDFVIMRRHYHQKPDFKKYREIVENSPERIELKSEQMSLFAMTDRERR